MIKFIDLAAQQRIIKDRIAKNIQRVLDHGMYINGPEVKELEEIMAEYVGVPNAVGCSSGTDALLMVLMALDIGPGDAVFTTTFSFIASAEVIPLLRATPVFVDIDPDTFNIDVNKLQEAIEKTAKDKKLKPRGILPVDIFGQPADYDEINRLAEEYGLFVLEDAAQSFGATYKGRKVGSLARVAATSFFPAKPMGCYGDGGMIFADDKEMYETLVSIRTHGKGSNKYDNVRVGLNGRLDTIQAAVLQAKMEVFDDELNLRQNVAQRYHDGLSDVCQIPHVKDTNTSSWAQYSILHQLRDKITVHMKERGIPTAIYYPKPLHLQTAFSDLGYREGDLPVSEDVAGKIFSLPMYPYLSSEDQNLVIESMREVTKS